MVVFFWFGLVWFAGFGGRKGAKIKKMCAVVTVFLCSVWFGGVRRPKKGKKIKNKNVCGGFLYFGLAGFGGSKDTGGPSSQEEKPPTLRSMVTKNRFCGLTKGVAKKGL